MNDVRKIRLDSGLTQEQLAARSGVAQPNIAAYETAKRRPSAKMLGRLRRAAAPLPHEILEVKRGDLLKLAKQHKMSNVRVFGSTSRHTDTPESDIDLLVDVPPKTGLMKLSAFALEAEALLGVKVDIVTDGGLRQDHPIRNEAVPL